MAKHRIGAERKPPRMSYLTRSPSEPPELMSLDESENLLGCQYGGNKKFVSPSVTIVELGSGPPNNAMNKRLPSITPTATPSPSPYTEQSTLTSAGKWCKRDYVSSLNFERIFVFLLLLIIKLFLKQLVRWLLSRWPAYKLIVDHRNGVKQHEVMSNHSGGMQDEPHSKGKCIIFWNDQPAGNVLFTMWQCKYNFFFLIFLTQTLTQMGQILTYKTEQCPVYWIESPWKLLLQRMNFY